MNNGISCCLLSKRCFTLYSLALVLFLCPMALAQSANLAVGSTMGVTGASVVLPITLTPGTAAISTLQFDLMFGSSFAYSGTLTGSAAAAAGKDAIASPIPGGVRVLLFGLNQNTMGAGVIANVQFTISISAPIGSSLVTISGIIAADPAAKVVATFGTPGSITTLGFVDTAAPVISLVSSPSVTVRDATITWTTNEGADSQVQYGTTTSYGNSTSVNSILVTSHSQKLTGLGPNTVYHYRVRSADTAGNAAVSGDSTFTTSAGTGNFVMTLPRFSAGRAADGLQTFQAANENLIGMALTNQGTAPAYLAFTALDSSGNLLTGPGIINPKTEVLNPKSQIGMLDSAVFGDAFVASNSQGWIKLETTSPDVRGFFLAFDARLSLMDGAGFGTDPMTDFAFTAIEPAGSTRIDVANGNPDDAIVTFNLMKADGTVRSSQSRVISANGALVADLYGELFSELQPDPGDYLRVHSTEGMAPFQLMQKGVGDIASLAGHDTTAGGATLYSPQYVTGGPWQTSLSVVNLDARTGRVTLRLIGENGAQIGTSRPFTIPAFGKLQIDDPGYFTAATPGEVIAGYVEIAGDGVRLIGSTVFGENTGQTFYSALPLISNLQSSVIFSHIASNDLYFTGIAILNPNAGDANVTIEVYAADGRMLDSRQELLQAKNRSSRLLTEYFPSLAGKDQSSGYIRVISNIPVASFALFGTNDLSVLSAIPPQ
jgi:hypothetical protein